MYDALLLISAAVILFLAIRIVIKIREMSGRTDDEKEERASEHKVSLPKDLQDLKIDDPNLESWDSQSGTKNKSNGGNTSEQKPR